LICLIMLQVVFDPRLFKVEGYYGRAIRGSDS
jgi:hypothetical protein